MRIRLLDENMNEIKVIENCSFNDANHYIFTGQASYYEEIKK